MRAILFMTTELRPGDFSISYIAIFSSTFWTPPHSTITSKTLQKAFDFVPNICIEKATRVESKKNTFFSLLSSYQNIWKDASFHTP